ncbi:MAG: malic enzyme-like NAD(P)-binding protein [archaeon]
MSAPRATYTKNEVLKYHSQSCGKIESKSKVPLKNFKDLTLAYTPGVAEVCNEIKDHPEKISEFTNRGNTVAVITDGTAVLGLGDIGPEAGLPVMEGKCVLFKELAGVDAVPILLNTKDPNEIIQTIKVIAPSFGGINLEDISAPRCFEIETVLKQDLNIPVFHDDQWGTAIVTLAGLLNALKLTGKKISEIKVAVSGAGAGGIACSKFYKDAGVKEIILCDSKGIVSTARADLNDYKKSLAVEQEGTLADAMKGADVFLGLSRGNIVSGEMVKAMAADPIIFACANPTPEIAPELAKSAGAKIIATGRSDYPNQINNVLGFPAIFRGAFDAKATEITQEMMRAAAKAIAFCTPDSELAEDNIITNPLDKNVMKAEAEAVADAYRKYKN